MLLAFELSGEHDTLPRAEVLACLDSCEEIAFLPPYLLIKCDDIDIELISKRLALTHSIINVLGISEPKKESIAKMIHDTPIDMNGSFSLRVKSKYKVRKQAIEREMGSLIQAKGYEVDLNNPSNKLQLVITNNICMFGLAKEINKSQFEARLPHNRPFFSPGVIHPKIARALVNLSRVKRGEIFLDSLCGTGGFLLEAGFIGCKLIGMDIQPRMVFGTRKNLNLYGLDVELMISDVTKPGLKDDSIDATVTDLPYGKSTVIKGKDLCARLLKAIEKFLKPNKYAVIASNTPINTNQLRVVDTFQYRVHRSLTRYITVFKNEKANTTGRSRCD